MPKFSGHARQLNCRVTAAVNVHKSIPVMPQAMARARSEHLVQLFDDQESLADHVSAFLLEGWKRREPLLVVARPAHWAAIRPFLEEHGCDVDGFGAGRLVVLDAAAALSAFLQNGRPVRDRFLAAIGVTVGTLSDRFGEPLRIYGEMVDILAAQGELASALQLEELWNELGSRYPMKLLCGYASGHFGDPRTASALRDICAAHGGASAPRTDLLAAWLLSGRGAASRTEGLARQGS